MRDVTYAPVGSTLEGEATPEGYRATKRDVVLGSGAEVFARVAAATMRWQIQRRSGIRVRIIPATPAAGHVGDDARLEVGDVAVMRVPLWPFDVPCSVVATLDEPRRVGFAYGTLPGHPEAGEEAFIVEHGDDDAVVLRIRAFSRPASWIFRLGYPAVLLMQRIYTDRYARSLREPRA